MSNTILEKKTTKALISMSVPISLGMLSTFLFQVIDTYFVGQLGAEALTALSFSSTVYFLLVGLFIGLSVGVSVIVGQAFGANDLLKVYKTVRIGLLISLLLSVFLVFLAIAFIDPIFSLLGATPEVLPFIKEYTIPLLMGIPLLTLALLIGSCLRATGNIVFPEVLMAIAGVINLFFDYALIFGKYGLPELGIKGAAYATVLSWIFVITGMIILLLKDGLLKFKPEKSVSTGSLVQEIRKLATPTIITQMMGPLTLMYLTFLIAQQSTLAVAAFGVASRIETLLMIGILGVSTAITPFIAQNHGAKLKARVEEAIAFGGRASTYLGLIVALLLYLFIKPIAALFSDNPQIVEDTANYFYVVSLSYVFYGLFIITSSIFNGLKLTKNSMRISLVKSLGFTIPFTLIGSFWGLNGIIIGLALSNVAAGIYAAYEMRKDLKRVNSELQHTNIFKEYLKDLKGVFSLVKK